jgi:hypothetical protein
MERKEIVQWGMNDLVFDRLTTLSEPVRVRILRLLIYI